MLGVFAWASCASGQAIDFETLPSGASTTDQQLISDEYEADFGVRFDLVDPVTLVSIGSPQIAKVGAPQTAFVGCGADTPLDGQGVGTSFLTDDNSISNQAGTLLLTYTDPVAQAAGVILDVDGRNTGALEEWTIEALDATMSIIDSVVLVAPGGMSECGGANGFGDGRAAGFLFNHASADIHFIVLRYTGNASSIGLAFDNFTPTTIPPPPTVTTAASTGSECFGNPIAIISAPNQGLEGFLYQWQHASVGGAFADIQGEILPTLLAPALAQAHDYRVVITDALLREAISNVSTISPAYPMSWTLKVETAVGSGVYDTIATDITPHQFNESLTTVYDWRQNEQYYHGGQPFLTLDRSHMFMTVAPGGQSLVFVHDAAAANGGGRTEMRAEFTGVTPNYAFKDDPFDLYRDEGTSVLRTRHTWGAPNTDGWAAGPLTDSWTAAIEFTDTFTGNPTIDGLADWYFYSADGSMYQLPLEADRKVMIEAVCNSCPADLTGDGSLNFFDISAFLSSFSAMDPIADFNGDGFFNFFDISAFLIAFSAGCP
ncbi:hypothetical protein COB72_05475 [bacterium]|nr:MAG: hypothetical protein COB72_05475 [bacterium]